MIELVDVTKDYALGDDTVSVLKGITLSIKDKEFVGVLGASGSGKSTLMHIMGLLDTPTSGRVLFDGRDVSKINDDELSRLRNEYVGFVFQSFNLINNLTVLENVLLPTVYMKRPAFDPSGRALDLLTKFDLINRKDFFPNRISGGQQQRAAIARALIMNPKLVLADEPTGNLDSKSGNEILSLLEKLNSEFGVTVVVVTHEKDIARRTSRQIFIRDGGLVKKYL